MSLQNLDHLIEELQFYLVSHDEKIEHQAENWDSNNE